MRKAIVLDKGLKRPKASLRARIIHRRSFSEEESIGCPIVHATTGFRGYRLATSATVLRVGSPNTQKTISTSGSF